MKNLSIKAMAFVIITCICMSMVNLQSIITNAVDLEEECKQVEESISGEYINGQALAAFKDKKAMQKFQKQNEYICNIKPEFDAVLDNNDGLCMEFEDESEVVSLIESSSLSTPELIARLNKDSNVIYSEPNYKTEVNKMQVAPNDTYFKYQWGLDNPGSKYLGKEGNDINVNSVWSEGITGNQETVVAVLDTGIDYEHPDLVENMWHNNISALPGKYGYNFVNKSTDPMDDNGHGTHCAGIIGACGSNGTGVTGINQNIKLMALKSGDNNGSFSTSSILAAYDYMAKAKKCGVNLRVVNNSWGGSLNSVLTYNAVKSLGKLGVTSVFAAGNESLDTEVNNGAIGKENLPYLITVAATNKKGDLAYFSNYGKDTVDVAAPGQEILSTVPRTLQEYYPELSSSNVVYENFTDKNTNGLGLTFKSDYGYSCQSISIDESRAYDGDKSLYIKSTDNNKNLSVISDPINLKNQKNRAKNLAFRISGDGNEYTNFRTYVKDKSGDWIIINSGSVKDDWSLETIDLYGVDIDYKNFSIKFEIVLGDNSEGVYIDTIGVGNEKVPYKYMSGTSMAAPMITGSYALLSDYNSNWSNEEIKARIVGGVVRDNEDLKHRSRSDGRFNMGLAISDPYPVLNKLEKGNGTATVSGYFFKYTGNIYVDGIECKVLDWSDNKINFELPKDIGKGNHEFVVETENKSGRAKFDLGKLKHQFKDLPFIDSKLTNGSLYNGTLVGCGDNLYYLGASDESSHIKLNNMYCYNLERGKWRKRSMPKGAVQGHDCSMSACEVEGKIWSIVPMLGKRGRTTTKLMCYNPTGDRWSNININYKDGKRLYLCIDEKARLVNYNGKVWVIGDCEEGINSKVWSIDPNTNTITSEKSIPVALNSMKVAVSGDKIILIGTKSRENSKRMKGQLYVYNGSDWQKGASLPKFKHGQECSFAIGATDNGIILTGMTDKNGNDTYKYNVSKNKWSLSKKRLDLEKLFTLSGTSYNERFYVIGNDLLEAKNVFKVSNL